MTGVQTCALPISKRNLKAQSPVFPNPGDPLSLKDWNDTSNVVGVGMRYQHELGGSMDHSLYGGFRYEREWIPSWTIATGPLPGGPLVETQDIEYGIDALSMHLDDTFHPADDWTVVLGGRFEYVPKATGENSTGLAVFSFDENFSAFLPGIGVSWQAREDWSLFANWFEGFRAPQVWGFGGVPDPSNSEIDFERSRAFELGTRYRPSENSAASATLWRNEYDDFGVFYSGFYENLGKISAEGIDLEADWSAMEGSLEGLSLTGSVTLQDTTLESGPNEGNSMPYAWDTKAAWRARYMLGESWGFSLGGTFVGSSFSDEANTVAENLNGNLGKNPARTLWDAQVTRDWDVGRGGLLQVGVGATNLLDEEWYVHSRGGFFGGGKVAGAPRQAFASVSFTINL